MRSTNLTAYQAQICLDYLRKSGTQACAKLERELEHTIRKERRVNREVHPKRLQRQP
jgi:hypothetical protein